MNRIDKKFSELRRKRKKAFIAFITAGYPDLRTTARLVVELERAGADCVELGVPFSDPMADGPVIQEASHEALKEGVTLRSIMRMVAGIREKVSIPVCLMTYYNPVFRYGTRPFIRDARQAGIDAVLIPDLPPEEDHALVTDGTRNKVYCIPFLAPTSSAERITKIGRSARGFIYYVSLTGVTGARSGVGSDIAAKVRVIRRHTAAPVCVGFGISTPQQVREIAAVADGVIVGSALVKKITEYKGKPSLVRAVGDTVRRLRTGL
jgi:tryptophan synthase alpha chain